MGERHRYCQNTLREYHRLNCQGLSSMCQVLTNFQGFSRPSKGALKMWQLPGQYHPCQKHPTDIGQRLLATLQWLTTHCTTAHQNCPHSHCHRHITTACWCSCCSDSCSPCLGMCGGHLKTQNSQWQPTNIQNRKIQLFIFFCLLSDFQMTLATRGQYVSLTATPGRPSSWAADKSWKRWQHSSPELEWLCSCEQEDS